MLVDFFVLFLLYRTFCNIYKSCESRYYRQFSTIVCKLGGQLDDGTLTNVLLVLELYGI